MFARNLVPALIGALCAALLATAFAASAGPGNTYFRRYQIQANDTHAFVLDTTTGRVWEREVALERSDVDGSFYRPKGR